MALPDAQSDRLACEHDSTLDHPKRVNISPFLAARGQIHREMTRAGGRKKNAPNDQISFHWTLNISCRMSNSGHADGLNKWRTYMSITLRPPLHPKGQAPGIMSG